MEEECGHSGWYQEGGYIASCTDAADCAKDNSKSTLNLFINLERDGSLSFTYTAHGEEFFDYLVFEVNDELVHSTQKWWSSGMFLRRFGVLLPAGEHKLSWSWVKDYSVMSLHILCIYAWRINAPVQISMTGDRVSRWCVEDYWVSDKDECIDCVICVSHLTRTTARRSNDI